MKRILIALLLAVLVFLAMTGLGLGVIHVTDLPYVVDVEYLEISEKTGIPKDEIMANYNAVMGFLSPFNDEEFDLPTFAYSDMGAEHFEDCKVIFDGFYLASAIAVLLIIALFVCRLIDRQTLKYSGVLTLAIPMVLALGAAINFNALFVWFHKIFFEGETWIFDPNVDEIIRILPEEFFMHCALFIALFWVLAAVAQFIVGLRGTKEKR